MAMMPSRKLLNAAILFATKKHQGQVDDDGNPYWEHPSMVGDLLEELGCDDEIVAAGYLHDTLEDTDTTFLELVENFGDRVACLVYEVTHEGKKDNYGYYFPRLKSRDAIMIKLADRLSNISRMDSWDERRKQQYLDKTRFWKTEPPTGA